MSLRVKLIVAMLATGLLSVALVGLVARERLMRRFDDLVLAHAARNFSGDVASYWLTYGSWEAGQRAEPFHHFVVRRQMLLAHREQSFDGRQMPDKGGALDAQALQPWTSGDLDEAPVGGEPTHARGGASEARRRPPPFRFVLFDPTGRILNPPEEIGRAVRPEEQHQAVPIKIAGKFVAFASPLGVVNYSTGDLAYIAAVWDAIGWGIGVAAVMAVAFGLFMGNQLSRSLRKLTRAIEGIQDGVLRQQVDIASHDEVGVLARAFNMMSSQLAISHEQLEASHRTITEQAEQLRELTVRDSLTGLYNRRHFDDCSKGLYEQAQRYGRPLSMVIADIDFFKRINDAFSHAIGDAVLREVGGLFRQHTRSSDLVVRYGGEEFVLAFPESGLEEAFECCERLRRNIETHAWQDLHPDLKVTISMGITDDLALGGVDVMLAAADRLLYQAKTSGRNRVCADRALPPSRAVKMAN